MHPNSGFVDKEALELFTRHPEFTAVQPNHIGRFRIYWKDLRNKLPAESGNIINIPSDIFHEGIKPLMSMRICGNRSNSAEYIPVSNMQTFDFFVEILSQDRIGYNQR